MSNLPSTEKLDLRAKIVEKIRASFVDLIPDDEWDRLVKDEIARFIKPQVTVKYGRTETEPSPLSGIVQVELQAEYTRKLKEELSAGKYAADMWLNGGPTAGDAVRQIIKDELPAIVEAAYGRVIQRAVDAMRNGIQGY